MVAGLTQSIDAKRTIENSMSTALSSKGVAATKSIEVFPPNFGKDITKEDMLNSIRKKGADAILTVSLVDKQTESRYVPGTYGYTPIPMYNRFWGYYNYMYPTMYSPNYYTEEKIYYMETNLYDADTEELVWSAESETYNPDNLSGFSQTLANIIANKLENDGLIGKQIVKPGNKTVSKVNNK